MSALTRPDRVVSHLPAALRRAAASALIIALLVGCGAKGPLYLPGPDDQRRADDNARR